jgi:hypothetical protein
MSRLNTDLTAPTFDELAGILSDWLCLFMFHLALRSSSDCTASSGRMASEYEKSMWYEKAMA